MFILAIKRVQFWNNWMKFSIGSTSYWLKSENFEGLDNIIYPKIQKETYILPYYRDNISIYQFPCHRWCLPIGSSWPQNKFEWRAVNCFGPSAKIWGSLLIPFECNLWNILYALRFESISLALYSEPYQENQGWSFRKLFWNRDRPHIDLFHSPVI